MALKLIQPFLQKFQLNVFHNNEKSNSLKVQCNKCYVMQAQYNGHRKKAGLQKLRIQGQKGQASTMALKLILQKRTCLQNAFSPTCLFHKILGEPFCTMAGTFQTQSKNIYYFAFQLDQQGEALASKMGQIMKIMAHYHTNQ